MKKLLYIFASFIISTNLFSQEAITQDNIQLAVNAWLEDSVSTQATYGHISDWDVSTVTDMSYMFTDSYPFNGDLSSWDVSNVTNMSYMFSAGAMGVNFSGDLSSWDVSSVTNMRGMFESATSFNGDLSSWDVSSVIDMQHMFYYANSFNGDLSSWEVSSVTNMTYMFNHALSFNGNLSSWDVSNVTNMSAMFTDANSFNGDISSWDVSSVTDMSRMFHDATSFNGDLSSWDVSNVTDMSNMFSYTWSFNGDLSSWDVSNVMNMSLMFDNAETLGLENQCAIQTSFSTNPNWPYDWVCHIYGCMDSMAMNYDSSATIDDAMCEYLFGCMDSMAMNYDSSATIDDAMCEYVYGCTDSMAMNYDPYATLDDAMCEYVYGCTDSMAMNYDPYATFDDAMCEYVYGCTDSTAFNYNTGSIFVGDFAEGGIVFYVDETGRHGLVAALQDLEGTYEWGCEGEIVNGAAATSIGTGYQNTIDIVNQGCESLYGGPTAAQAALDYVMGGYSDWYLPSIDELTEMFFSIGNASWDVPILNINEGNEYWSSTSMTSEYGAFPLDLSSGIINTANTRNDQYYVYPIRSFTNDPCIAVALGCIDANAINFASEANTDDGSCIAVVNGCTDINAFNYDELVNNDDGSCIAFLNGCTEETAFNYNAEANIEDGSCNFSVIYGCMDPMAMNYDPDANTYSSCYYPGCTDPSAINWDDQATYDDGSCYYSGEAGCMDETAFNYNAESIIDDGSCVAVVNGCTSEIEFNSSQATYVFNVDQAEFGAQTTSISSNEMNLINESNDLGCNAFDFDFYGSIALIKRGVCEFGLKALNAQNAGASAVIIYNNEDGIISMTGGSNGEEVTIPVYSLSGNDGLVLENLLENEYYVNYFLIDGFNYSLSIFSFDNPDGEDGSCIALFGGCTNETAFNYNTEATTDDGSCNFSQIYGCMDPMALNWDDLATLDNGSCYFPEDEFGCMEMTAINYSPYATIEDGFCDFSEACSDPMALNYNPDPSIPISDWNCIYQEMPEIYGCMDTTAINYYFEANTDDGSCVAFDELDCMEMYGYYNPQALGEDGSCFYPWDEGCMDMTASNYNPEANIEDGSCFYNPLDELECMEMYGYYNPEALEIDATCFYPWDAGCMEMTASNYNLEANIDDGSCMWIDPTTDCGPSIQEVYFPLYLPQGWGMFGFTCTNPMDLFDAFQTILDQVIIVKDAEGTTFIPEYGFNGIGDLIYSSGYQIKTTQEITDFSFCPTLIVSQSMSIEGCLDPSAMNFNPQATDDDGSCEGGEGCTDLSAENYNLEATNSCPSCCDFNGCTDATAFNYDPGATLDDGSCGEGEEIFGCTDLSADNYNLEAHTSCASCCDFNGCTDATAFNYDEEATLDDGSCFY